MILVAGLTPAWQQIVVLDRLRPGEVNRAREVHWCGSGKVLNVGLALTQLGTPSRTLSLVGSGPSGESLRSDMAKLRVPVRWIDGAATQRVCSTLLDGESGQMTEIVENFPAATAAELVDFTRAFACEAAADDVEFVVLTGSLPQGSPSDYFADLLSQTHAKTILDIRGPELLAALRHKPWIVKPNRDELSQTVQRPLATDEDVWNAMFALIERGANWVIVTDGPRDVFVANQSERFRVAVPHVDVVNPIGCGDCFTAGLATALLQKRTMCDSTAAGIAAAAQNAAQILPARISPIANLKC